MGRNTEIEDEAVEVFNVVVQAVNNHYGDKSATIGVLLGMNVAFSEVSKGFEIKQIENVNAVMEDILNQVVFRMGDDED